MTSKNIPGTKEPNKSTESSSKQKKIIVIPTYNEKQNIKELVPLLFAAVPDAHVLVVDDNSPDGTAANVEMMMKIYPQLYLLSREGKQGLGKAYIHAFKEILKDPSFEMIVMMDADFSHDPKYLPKMFELAKGADIIIGSRYVQGGRTQGWEFWRRFLSRGANYYCRLITSMPIYDCTGGFNVIHAKALKKLDLNSLDLSGYAFIMELKYALHRSGAKFAEHPIVFVNRKEGESKMSSHIINEGIIAPWKMIFKK